MFALYAFARTTDDLGDSHDPISVRTVRLDWWREITRLNLECDGMISSDGLVGLDHAANADAYLQVGFDLRFRAISVLPALLHTARQFSIPTRYFLEIVDGVKADQQKTRFDTYEQLSTIVTLSHPQLVWLACIYGNSRGSCRFSLQLIVGSLSS